jgi:hypothetical protein
VFYDTLDDAIQAEDSITTFANMLDEAGLLKLVTSPGTSGTLFAPTNDVSNSSCSSNGQTRGSGTCNTTCCSCISRRGWWAAGTPAHWIQVLPAHCQGAAAGDQQTLSNG